MHKYSAVIRRIVDGDTVVVDIDLGFDICIREETIRLYGIDAPEIRTSDSEEKIFGLYAKQYVGKLLIPGDKHVLISKDFRRGKYGRCLGDFKIDDQTLTEKMLIDNVAVRYCEGPGSKDRMRSEHLTNRKILREQNKV